MALRLIKPVKSISPCDITSPISKSLRAERLKQSMPASFLKYEMHIIETLGSKSAAQLFCALEYRFQKKPLGFYKFMSPCDNPFYKKGDSLSEELKLKQKAIWRALKKICTVYASKSLYLASIEEHGELGVFQGKPFLSYFNRITRQTFYLRDYRAVKEIRDGTFKIDATVTNKLDIYVSKDETQFLHLREITENNDLYVTERLLSEQSLETSLTPVPKTALGAVPKTALEPLSPAETKAEEPPSENTLQRIPLSLYLSLGDSGQPEQPKEEEIKIELDGNTEQPVQSLDIVSKMIETWRRVTQLDLSISPNKSTVDNLSNSYKDLFGSSLEKWEAYCMLILSSKYLMGETIHKFKLNLAWASKPDTFIKITEGHYTTGDRINVIYLDLEPISDPDPIILKLKHTCLDKMGKAKYISWIKPMGISRNISGEIVCVAPTIWFAKHISTNDFLGFGYFMNELSIPKIVVKHPDGSHAGTIYPHSSK